MEASVEPLSRRVVGHTTVVGHTFAHGEIVVAMTEFKGRLIIATSSDLYEVVDRHLVRMHLEYVNSHPAA